MEAGYDVVSACDSNEAFDVFRKTPHLDLLIIDLVLPNGVSGYAVGHRAAIWKREAKILYMTAFDCPAGESNVIPKSIGATGLLTKVNRVLSS